MKYFTLIVLLILSSCGGVGRNHNSIIVGSSKDDYRIISIDPPKHFSVTVQNLRTNEIFQKVGRKKRCYRYRNGPKKGDVVKITTLIYRDTLKNYKWNQPSDDDVLDLYYCK